MRWLLTALLVLAAAVGAAVLLQRYPGSVLVEIGPWIVETSTVVAAIGLLILFLLLHFIVRITGLVLRTPRAWREGLRGRRADKSRRNLIRGLIEMAEGRWESAERLLVRGADNSETALLNYLAAARAAQQIGAYERRDRYLKAAIEGNPEADLPVSLTQAELQLAHRQTEHALATLTRLRSLAPGHGYVLKLLSRLFTELEDWHSLAELLPELRRRRVVPGERLQQLERQTALGCLAGASPEPRALLRFWESLRRTTRDDPAVLRAYARRLVEAGEPTEAEKRVRQYLNRHWDEALVREYGLIPHADAARQLDHAEGWLANHGRSPMLLLTLGRLCVRNQLWGKARAFLESSVGIEPRVETYHELAELLEQLGETGAAREYSRAGLKLAAGQEEATPPQPGSTPASRMAATASGA